MTPKTWVLHGLWVVPVLAGLAAGLWLLVLFDPNQPGSPLPGCVFRSWTGFLCPGCGATRAVHALIHADPVTALRMNALFVLGMPVLPVLMWRLLKPLPAILETLVRPIARPWLWLGLYVGFGVARNLPYTPFTWLAPPGIG